jgi:hypothetical protein
MTTQVSPSLNAAELGAVYRDANWRVGWSRDTSVRMVCSSNNRLPNGCPAE